MTVVTVALLVFAVFVVAATVAGVLLISFREAADVDQTQPQDLNELEQKVVDREP